MLYWGKGNKKDFILTNSDPNLIRVFVKLALDALGIKKEELQISIRLYEDLDRRRCLLFWSKVVGIQTHKFQSVHILSGKKIGKLQYGMCRIRVKKGGLLLKKLNGINKAVVEEIEK